LSEGLSAFQPFRLASTFFSPLASMVHAEGLLLSFAAKRK
jgi:hypothetical protein